MDAVFLKILNMSITASYVIAAVLVIRLLIRKAPKKYSYLLWSAVGFRLCCPISFQSIFSLFSLGLFHMTQAQSASAAMLEYVPQNIARASQPQVTVGIPAANAVIGEMLPAATPAVSVNPMQIWIAVGTAVWCAGILTFLLYGVISYIRLRRRMASAVLLEENIYQSDNVRSPFILGLFRPKIYIPFGLDDRTRRYVLAHEQYHIRRLDHIIKPLAFLLLAVHWFNPLCYLAFYLMGKDMEMSCDEKVLAGEGNIRKAYSTSLLSFASNRRFPSPSPLAFGETGVKSRIKNVLHWKRPKVWVTLAAAALCVAVVAACAANPAQPKEQAQPFDHTYRVENILYDSPVYSFSYTVQTAPLYLLDRLGSTRQLSILEDQKTGNWLHAGSFEETELTEGNFDRYFIGPDSGWQEEDRAAALRRENQNAWQLDVSDSTNAVFYYLLQQKNGDVYLSYGYRNTEGETDRSSIRWLFKLTRADEISYILDTAGKEMLYKPQWYAKNQFGFDNDSLPAVAVYDEGTLTFLSEQSPDTLTVKEDYFTYQGEGDAVREEQTYELKKNADGGYELDVRRRSDAHEEYAVYRIEEENGCYAFKVLFPLQVPETIADVAETAVAYVSSECLYMNPLSSFAAVGGDSGCRYVIGTDSFFILNKSTGDVQSGASLLHSQWQAFPYTREQWLALFTPRFSSDNAVSSLNSAALSEVLYRPLSDQYFLLNVKNQLWLVETHQNEQMGRHVWSIYTLVPELDAPTVEWRYMPYISSVYPAFPLYFDVPCTEISAACTAGELLCLDTDQRGANLTVPAGSVLYWAPMIENDVLRTEESAQISFAVYDGESVLYNGTVYLTRDADASGGATAVYRASLAGSGLVMKQTDAWQGGAVISSTKATLPISVDLDRDGTEELLTVEQLSPFEYALKVIRPDGTLLWSESAGTAHVGWNSLFLCTLNGEYYLLRYNPWLFQGYGNYSYSLFTLEGGVEHVVAENSIDFDVNGTERITPEMTAFADEINALLKNSVVLVSTQNGNAIVGPASSDSCLETYDILE